MDCTRYAIWWVPSPGSRLARFGMEWTGWCADSGTSGARRALSVLSRPRAGVPGAVRLRGLHATIRASFRLAEGRSAWALDNAMAELAGRTAPLHLPRLRLTVDAGRVVLAPRRTDEAVKRLLTHAHDAVLPFEAAPGVAAPTGAVAAGGLFVPEDGRAAAPASSKAASPVRFRLPLTDRMDPREAAEIVSELEPVLESVLAQQHTVADLALVGDPGRGRPWRLLDRYPLEGERSGVAARPPAGMNCRGPSLMAPFGRVAA